MKRLFLFLVGACVFVVSFLYVVPIAKRLSYEIWYEDLVVETIRKTPR